MRKTTLPLIFLLLFSGLSEAHCPSRATVFFGNGMFNSFDEAQKSLDALVARVSETENWKRSWSDVAYNFDEPAVYQLLEVLEQKSGDLDKRFWRWFWDWSEAPDWFRNIIKARMLYEEKNGHQRYSLGSQLIRYQKELMKDRGVIVVAHSQGNFFANSAALHLAAGMYPVNNFYRVISVATPASFVDGDGPYFTLTSDGVIRWIPGALPPNATNVAPAPGLLDHKFVEHYLQGQPTGEKIVTAVQSTLEGLLRDAKKAQRGWDSCWRWLDSLNLPKNDENECVIRCGTAKMDFSNFSCGSLCETYCSCLRRR